MSVQATIACVVFVITILLLVFKPIPIIITGALVPTVLALFGIIKADTAFADFTNSTSIFMICFCIIGSAFFKTGLADFLGTKIIGVLGKNEICKVDHSSHNTDSRCGRSKAHKARRSNQTTRNCCE